MIGLPVLLLSWLLLFSCIFLAVLEIICIVWTIAELRAHLHHLKLQKAYREDEYEALANQQHIRLWRRTHKRLTFTHKLTRKARKG